MPHYYQPVIHQAHWQLSIPITTIQTDRGSASLIKMQQGAQPAPHMLEKNVDNASEVEIA